MSGSNHSGPARDVAALIGDIAKLVRMRVDRFGRAHNLTQSQYVTLSLLQHWPGSTQNEIATLSELEPITVSRQVEQLERNGYLERRPDPMDRRLRRIHLLPSSEHVLSVLGHFSADLRREAMCGLSLERRARVADMLQQMRANLARPAANQGSE
jgi:MarR family transcriptional regulator, transcriptional regulator for hemolysin